MTRRAWLRTMASAGLGTAVGTGSYGFLYERHAVTVTRATVTVSGLPPALAGIKIGLLTDVHRSRWVAEADVTDAVSMLNAEQPDIVVLGGDFVTWGDRGYVDASAEALRGLSAPQGVFAILGNHDDDHDMPAALTARGIQVLKDARTRISLRSETLEFVGIRFWTRRAADIAAVARGAKGTVVLLAHDPRRFSEARALNIPLVLSGHTHGGQVVLPILGAIAAQKFPVVSGTARRETTTLFVSRGLGTVYVPMRVGCPPEVAVLTLAPG